MINNPNNADGGQAQQAQIQQVSAKEFAAKFKSKRECYTFLAVEGDIYLPPYGKSSCSLDLCTLRLKCV